MSKKQNFTTRMTIELTTPKNKKVFMRSILQSGDTEIHFEGEMKEVRRWRKAQLPKHCHVEWVEGTGKFYWYYLGRHEGKKDYSSKKRFAKYDAAVLDCQKYFMTRK